jgi:hypothetical protein
MKTVRVLARGLFLGRRPAEHAAESADLPALCPAARCSRCGYEFPPQTISATCPRCLEPFSREQCYGGCFSCPLLAGARSRAVGAETR